MEQAAARIGRTYQCSVLVKGGHAVQDANDFLWQDGKGVWYSAERVDNPNTHGTGCTLSSAIASNLAKGMELQDAVGQAKRYLTAALGAMLDLGRGSGPLDHGAYIFCEGGGEKN